MPITKRLIDADNLAWCHDGAPFRILDVVGPDAFGFDEDFVGTDAASDAIPGWTATLVEAGAGESTVTVGTASGGQLILTTDSNEDDGVNLQMDGESFELTTGQRMTYFGIKLQVSEATQSDLLVGLCITDTTLLGGMTDGVYFECLDGGTGISCVTEKDSTETQDDDEGTLADATDIVLEIYYEPSTVYFLINGTLVSSSTTNIPNDEALTPSVHFLTGAASAETCTIDWIRAFQVGR
jgi:hypothetical protein